MILKDEVFPIGEVIKPHGVNWRTVIQLYIGCFRSTENIEFLIIEIQGILVPFLSRSIALNPNQPD